MRTAGARPPVLAFFLGRVLEWTVLVCACALPLAITTWRQFTPTERLAETLGVFVWAVVMVIVAERLRWPQREDRQSLRGALTNMVWDRWASREADRRSTLLRAGALATAIVHAGLAILGGGLALFLWFAPVVLIVSYLPLISEIESEFWAPFMMTLMCGGQSAIAAWLFGRGIDRARRALGARSH
jgi:hypothetical protein